MIWALNPLGGQLSLRVVTRESNITTVETDFLYFDPSSMVENRHMEDANTRSLPTNRIIENIFATALMTPVSSKNGTQDSFGNIQVPMLEYLMHEDALTDSDGWFHTMDQNLTGFRAAIAHVGGVPARTRPIYASILGLPFMADSLSDPSTTNSSTLGSNNRVDQIKRDLFGSDTVNTRSNFTMQTSYMYTDCTTKPPTLGPVLTPEMIDENTIEAKYTVYRTKKLFPNATSGVADSGHGFAIAYDQSHNSSGANARNITLRSWLGLSYEVGFVDTIEVISEASCLLTTTYVEAQVLCVSPSNCSVAKIRRSELSNNPSPLASVLDGLTLDPLNAHWDHGPAWWEDEQSYGEVDLRGNYARQVAGTFFSYFVNATSVDGLWSSQLSPLESYFANVSMPFRASEGGGNDGGSSGYFMPQGPITDIGDKLFSYRLSQLINTYWLSANIPQSLMSGIEVAEWRLNDEKSDNNGQIELPRSHGEVYIETKVLRCHKAYFAVLLVISLGLFILGVATTYLDATRRGPDVLDDFVNSLRHNPYVHVETVGPSMQDGQEIARRLRNTVVQMGDVCPNNHHGYVAIGTPHPNQPIERLDPRREYL